MKFPAVSRGSALASAGLSMDVLWACSSVTLLPGLRPSLVTGLGFAGDAGCVRDQWPESQVTFPSPKEGCVVVTVWGGRDEANLFSWLS